MEKEERWCVSCVLFSVGIYRGDKCMGETNGCKGWRRHGRAQGFKIFLKTLCRGKIVSEEKVEEHG